MRLLNVENYNEFSLSKSFVDNVPPYAILSHTWGEDEEEITFQDLRKGSGKRKAGYKKIRFCREQATKDNLRYVWIDTCCIDKSNSTELSEALNSMFRWYHEAAKCYVYLSDVSAGGSKWELAFRSSKWFTRGWTLQELIAPKSVEFFSKEGIRLGDKNSLGQQVYEITGVPIDALRGEPLSSFPVHERISWASKRETKRAEDKAYSLMGIFGIHMSPIYGEGKDEAFERLYKKILNRQEKLPVSKNKNWFNINSSTGQDDQTVFDLIPTNEAARAIVRDNLNSRRVEQDPNDPSKLFLRIGFHPPSKTPGLLAKFGRYVLTSDIVLGKGWSRMDQCYFDFQPETGEVLLHDTSTRKNTQLISTRDRAVQIRKDPRQCVVLLDREWIFKMGRAEFHLKPRVTQDPQAFTEERLSFARQPVPNEYEGTYEETYERALLQLQATDLESLKSSGYNTRMNTPFQPEPDNEIIYTKLTYLGGGSQGCVYKVVDMHTGDYYACKVIQPKHIPGLEITEKDFKLKIEAQVALLKDLRHDHILPYLCSQGWSIDQDINIFQPLCEGNFSQQIANFKSKEEQRATTMTMFYHISLGLHYIHTHDPIIIHRDIKPQNIMYRRGKYLLGDFGIAATVDNSHSLVGTNLYMAPEIWQGGDQTTKLDIWGLGATIVEALYGFPKPAKKPATWRQWHRYLQTCANKLPIASMLVNTPDQRPAAQQIICTLFPDPLSSTQIGSTKSSLKIPQPTQRNDTTFRKLARKKRRRTHRVHHHNLQGAQNQNITKQTETLTSLRT